MARKPSLYSDERECWICHSPYVECHHVYGGVGRRPISDREGCYVFLCKLHHNGSNFGVHFDKELDTFFKTDCQRRWMRREVKEYNAEHAEEIASGELVLMTRRDARDLFRKTFHISYLDDDEE